MYKYLFRFPLRNMFGYCDSGVGPEFYSLPSLNDSILTALFRKLLLILLLRICSHKLIAKVIIIRYFLRSMITHMMGLISNVRMELYYLRMRVYVENKRHVGRIFYWNVSMGPILGWS